MASQIVGISGNITRPSRTRVLVDGILAEIAGRGLGETTSYDLLDAGPELGTATSRNNAPEALDRVWRAIETCDALVVGSPTYKGSYSGLLKHLFDLLDGRVLVGRPVLLSATARAKQHALMIEHQWRPLFGFFNALTLPFGIFTTEEDFATPSELTDDTKRRIAAAVDQLERVMGR